MKPRVLKRKSRWDASKTGIAKSNPSPSTKGAKITESKPSSGGGQKVTATPTVAACAEESVEERRKGMRNIQAYERVSFIDQGSYGMVFQGRDVTTGKLYAIKSIKVVGDGLPFPLTALREANILMSLPRHPNIIYVREMLYGSTPDKFYMAMEMADVNLSRCLKIKLFQSVGEIKCLFTQLLSAVAYLHKHWIVHRDIKPSNLLYCRNGRLKLCDFGMARKFSDKDQALTADVVTLWYRAPEVLLGKGQYSENVDEWSVGCLLGEMLKGHALFQGQGDADQAHVIFKTLGKPSEESWPGYSQLPNASMLSWRLPSQNTLRDLFPRAAFVVGGGVALSNSGFEILSSLLLPCPSRRMMAAEALESVWLREQPTATALDRMPAPPTGPSS